VGTVLPAATASLADLLPTGASASTMEWPGDLWICACTRDGGERTVFGRPGGVEAPLHAAVAASCSIPGYLAPVRIGVADYVDGGLHSPTNVDVLRGEDLDLVVVVSPMSGPSRGVDRGVRRWAGRRLEAEVRGLEQDGVTVVTFEPGRATSRLLGLNPMSRARADRIVRAAYFEAGRRILEPGIAESLSPVAAHRSLA